MLRPTLPKWMQEMLYAEEYGLLDDPVGHAVRRAIQAGVADSFVWGLLHGRVERHGIQQAFAGPFAVPRLRQGDFTPGLDRSGKVIRFPSRFLNEPALTIGGTGSGKTTKSRFNVLQLAPRVRGLWLFDFRKREFAVLARYLARIGVTLIIVPGRKLRLNPLQVPEFADPRDYAPSISEALVRILELPPRAKKLFHATILQLYGEFGVFEGSREYPTLFDLRESIAGNKAANPQARHAAVDSLDPVLMSLREVLCYRYGWTTGELAKRRIVFELGGLSETDKDVILNTLLIGEFTSRIARGLSNPEMDLYICCDEAARLVGREDSSISDMIGLIRGTGIGLDLSVQSAEVARRVLSNTPNKFIGRCSSFTDYDIVGSSIGLTAVQRRWLATHLVPGLFLGHLGQGRWRHPFLFRVPNMDLKRMPREPESTGDIDGLNLLPVSPA